ncbi:MAG: PilN domain-containing protein [Pedobacter sp.]
MIRINLLPVREAQKRAKFFTQMAVALVVLGVVVVGCFGLYFFKATQIAKKKAEIQAAQTEINQLKKAIGDVANFKNKQKELQGKLDVLSELKNKKNGPVHLLDELSSVLPKKLWIESFKESGGNISIEGVGLNEETVAVFMKDLESSPYYKDVELKVTQQIKKKELKLQKFSVACKSETPSKQNAK